MIARAVWSSQVSIEGDCRAILSIFLIKPTIKHKKKIDDNNKKIKGVLKRDM
jgi:hypothetical protein